MVLASHALMVLHLPAPAGVRHTRPPAERLSPFATLGKAPGRSAMRGTVIAAVASQGLVLQALTAPGIRDRPRSLV